MIQRIRDWFASHLGIDAARKAEIYLELSKSSALGDAVYWLQLLFGAGIATLGLVLDSPAVIIGAMLISPLMGPILAAGLALATGDVLLGIRAVINIALSCLAAVCFSMLLIGILPFKETTGEIAARIRPSTLDLGVALFSGAIGSIAICRPTRGIITSMPGVAIAVALMPPLCVCGFGIGIAASVSGSEGWRIAAGGGLLFLTNLFAITFTAMLVFLALHIDLESVLVQVREWRDQDREMKIVRSLVKYLPASQSLRRIGGLPGRTLLISAGLLLIAFPLSRSMIQINQEILSRKRTNEIRQLATEAWNSGFSRFPNGEPRSYLGQVVVEESAKRISLQLRVFTNRPCTGVERAAYVHDVASRLRWPDDGVDVALIEIPTASKDFLGGRAPVEAPHDEASEVSPWQLRGRFLSSMDSALSGIGFPDSFTVLNWRLEVGRTDSLGIEMTYCGAREIGRDAQSLIEAEIRDRIGGARAGVIFRRIGSCEALVRFRPGRTEIPSPDELDRIGRILREDPLLGLEVREFRGEESGAGPGTPHRDAIARFLKNHWDVDSTRIVTGAVASSSAVAAQVLLVPAASHPRSEPPR